MRSIQLIIPDLLPPQDWAQELFAGLHLPGLEALLARGERMPELAHTLEDALCRAFGLEGSPVAPIGAQAEGLSGGRYWLRADPVHLLLQSDKVVALPVNLAADEAATLVSSLNQHFDADGLEFFAPHPQRWYLRLEQSPDLRTMPLSQVLGRDIRSFMPQGEQALRWHRLFNEAQMLLHLHPLNQVREERGERSVNGIWLWGGGGADTRVQPAFAVVNSDQELAGQFAQLAGAECSGWGKSWQSQSDSQLLVYGGLGEMLRAGDWQAWRTWVQGFEAGYAQPLLAALQRGGVQRLELHLPKAGSGGVVCALTPAAAWKVWRRAGLRQWID